jgi:hypothetical protein
MIARPGGEPSKITKTNFDGFDGSLPEDLLKLRS